VLRTPAGEVEIGTAYEAGAPGGRDKRIVKIDGEIVKSQAALAEHTGALWLTPQMDRLFLEGPGARRRFLDRLVFDSDPAHAGRVNAYDHAMRERTALLRDGGGDAAWLATLEDTLATRGVAVAAARLDVVRRLARHLTGDEAGRRTGAFPGAEITAVGEIESWLADGPALAAEDRFRDRLAAERGRDGAEGRAATGPHRSDLAVRHLGNGQAAALCSTGEQKALLVALVLATARMRAYEQGPAPLLLLDEIAAHLDARRLEVLFDEIIQLGAQVWMTGTDSALFRPLAGRAQFFTVVDATVTH
jgi:DNA replication and repair protein RecF